jgi:hypothetical protein
MPKKNIRAQKQKAVRRTSAKTVASKKSTRAKKQKVVRRASAKNVEPELPYWKRAPRQIMLSFFDFSTAMAKPWAEAGYLCFCIDVQHPPGENSDPANENIIRVGAHIEDWLPPGGQEIVFASFFPPCTDLAVSGARWFRDKGVGKLYRSIGLFHRSQQLAELFNCPYLIENPVSTISSYWRKPDYAFHPSDYGDPYLKKTCIWAGGGFIMQPKKPVKPTEGMKLYWLGPSEDRANLRSVTPQGFARAVFDANDPTKLMAAKKDSISKWRAAVMQRWHDECAVTGSQITEVISPVHFIREPAETAHSTLDTGIVLEPRLARLYDKGLIAFLDDGKILVSDLIPSQEREALRYARVSKAFSGRERALAGQHRQTVFRLT